MEEGGRAAVLPSPSSPSAPGAVPNAVVVVFLCLGSLGDVLPVLAVARRLSVRYRPHLVTHALYQERLAPFLPSTTPFTGLPLSPLPPPDAGPEHVQAELEACLGACRAALRQAQQPKSPGPSLLCANLVAKFAYHIAGVLGVPFALLAPSIPPPGPAPSAATVKALVGADAVLQRLRLADHDAGDDGDDDAEADGIRYRRRPVGMGELRHWMLSLLLPQYREFRRRHGLPETFLPASPDEPLPDAMPLLYGVSSFMQPKPGFYPRSAHFCGSWFVDDNEADASSSASFGAAGLEDFLPPDYGAPPTLVCVDMGSMAEVGMGVDWLALATAAARAVWVCRMNTHAGLRLLLLHFPSEVTIEALRAGLKAEEAERAQKRARLEDEDAPLDMSWVRVLPPAAFVAHAMLFPHCRAVVHHGGLGTTVACIMHGGAPQLVVPCTDEQAMWGETVQYKGMGLTVGLSLLRGGEGGAATGSTMAAALAPALARLLDEEEAAKMRGATAQCRAAMAGEDGVDRAVRMLEKMIEKRARG